MHLVLTIIFYVHYGLGIHAPIDTIDFSIVHNNKIIGELKATQTFEDGHDVYSNYTKTTTHLIKDINVLYEYVVNYKDGKLQESNVAITINGKPHSNTHTLWKGDEYQIVRDGKKQETVEYPTTYSSVMFLFEEPENVDHSFSEIDGSFHPLVPLGNHVYEKTNPEGRVNRYHYKSGKLVKAEIDAGLIHFEIIRME